MTRVIKVNNAYLTQRKTWNGHALVWTTVWICSTEQEAHDKFLCK